MDLYQIFISSSLCDFTLNYKISAHLHNLFMDFPQFKVPNWGLHEERYSEKTNDNKDIFSSVTCSLHSIECNKFFEICTGIIFDNDKS